MKTSTVLPILAGLVGANPVNIEERQSCPGVYVFGARETTAPAGYGTSSGLVNQIVAAYSGAQSAAISYPACGGQSSCGGVSYDSSVTQGTAAVVSAVNSLNSRCPSTKIVLIGYSQGGQIMDNALCGGAGATLTGTALAAVKAAIFLGDPRKQYLSLLHTFFYLAPEIRCGNIPVLRFRDLGTGGLAFVRLQDVSIVSLTSFV